MLFYSLNCSLQDLLAYLETAFGSLACVNGSFLTSDNAHYGCSAKVPGVDLKKAEQAFTIISRFENSTIKELVSCFLHYPCKCTLNSVENWFITIIKVKGQWQACMRLLYHSYHMVVIFVFIFLVISPIITFQKPRFLELCLKKYYQLVGNNEIHRNIHSYCGGNIFLRRFY